MVDWHKDRNRRLKHRARVEEFDAKIAEALARPARKTPPKISKAELRKTAEDLVRKYEDKLRHSDADPGSGPKRRGKTRGR
jgi:hypothetical protein